MNIDRKVVEQALVALEEIKSCAESEGWGLRSCGEAITALRQALQERSSVEQPAQQEPVAWMVDVDLANYQGQSEYRTILAWNAKPVWSGTHEINEVLKAVPLYTRPQAREPQEPVECMCGICKLGKRKPLTDEQIVAKALHLSGLGTHPDVLQFARAIEAAHGIGEKK